MSYRFLFLCSHFAFIFKKPKFNSIDSSLGAIREKKSSIACLHHLSGISNSLKVSELKRISWSSSYDK